MNKIILNVALIALFSCTSKQENKSNEAINTENEVSYNAYGDEINLEGAVEASELVEKLKSSDSLKIKVKGVIDEVCQAKGCWMDIKVGEEDYFTVKFKDYSFFVPKDAGGKEAIFEGVAFMDTISVADLKHYAEDAGKPDSVINAITEPEINIGFTANGVLIKE